MPRQQSALVTAAGIVNLVVAALQFLAAGALMFAGPMLASFLFDLQVKGLAGNDPDAQTVMPVVAEYIVQMSLAVGMCIGLLGLLPLLAGIGVLQRQQYGRVLSLVLAGLTCVVLLGSIARANDDWLSLLLQAGYVGLIGYSMLAPEYAAEFASAEQHFDGARDRP